MVKTVQFLTILMCSAALGNEQFSVSIHFEDAAGNKDTVIFGYDSSATDSIDEDHGETNIVSVPWKSGLDVRLAEQGARYELSSFPYTSYQSKKQITYMKCGERAPVHIIEIFTGNWPVTATWDSSLFKEPCLNKSAFSTDHSDKKGRGNLIYTLLSGYDAVTFTQQVSQGFWYTLRNRPDTVNIFWITFNWHALFPASQSSVNDKKAKLPPVLFWDLKSIISESGNIKNFKVFNYKGKSLDVDTKRQLFGLENGIYFLQMEEEERPISIYKILRNNNNFTLY